LWKQKTSKKVCKIPTYVLLRLYQKEITSNQTPKWLATTKK
jgi:hypothetical protein